MINKTTPIEPTGGIFELPETLNVFHGNIFFAVKKLPNKGNK